LDVRLRGRVGVWWGLRIGSPGGWTGYVAIVVGGDGERSILFIETSSSAHATLPPTPIPSLLPS